MQEGIKAATPGLKMQFICYRKKATLCHCIKKVEQSWRNGRKASVLCQLLLRRNDLSGSDPVSFNGMLTHK